MNRRTQFLIMTGVGLATLTPCIWLANGIVDYPDHANLVTKVSSQAGKVKLNQIFPGNWEQLQVQCDNQQQTLKFVTTSESQNLNSPRFKVSAETLNLCQQGSKTFANTDSVEIKN